jgi:hypothetical protein
MKFKIDETYSQTWHRNAVGGMWDQIGRLQFEFLVFQGLKPCHNFLDVGCGSLRGGIHFINYLEKQRYFGVDKDASILRAGRDFELTQALRNKQPNLVQLAKFDFSVLGVRFDFALAQSVFTHLAISDIVTCLHNIRGVLADGGKFFATFFEVPAHRSFLEPLTHHPGKITTFHNRDPYHYYFRAIEEVSHSNRLAVKYLGDWNHPRSQKMLVFTCNGDTRLPEDPKKFTYND